MSGFMIRGELRFKNARLVKAREEVGMNQKAFAEYLGIDHCTYNGCETMRLYPSPRIRKILASFCDCSEEELFPPELKKYADGEDPRVLVQVAEIEPARLIGRTRRRALLLPSTETADAECDWHELLKEINSAFNILKPEELLAIRLYYGLDGYEPHTLDEAGVVMGVTSVRVRQRREMGLAKLRHQKTAERLEPFYDAIDP